MQEIFYNGNVVTNNDEKNVMPAMMINDGSVFFVGENEEVLNLKTDEVTVKDLKQDFVYPALFDVSANIFSKIDNKLKNAKKIKNFQNSDEIDENYENFANFEEYKTEYLKIEKEYIKNGIKTIFELGVDKRAFAFWKKMSEDKLLTIDIVGYVDIIGSKQVMDDNCVTYRKYRNHFRLGGYKLNIDGTIQELKAWLKKPYSGTKSHYGAGEVYGEHLYYILKMALEERKQVLFELDGDKSLEEVLTVLSEIEEKEKITEFYRPIFYGASIIGKKHISKIKHFDGTIVFVKVEKDEEKLIKKFLGYKRKKLYHNYKLLLKNDIKFIVLNKKYEFQNYDAIREIYFTKKRVISKFNKDAKFKTNFIDFLFKLIYKNPAYISFDQDTKATLETQKRADFIVTSHDIFDLSGDVKKSIKSVYIDGEKKY